MKALIVVAICLLCLSCSEDNTYMPDSRPDCFDSGIEVTIELPGPVGKGEIAYEITWRIRMTEEGPRCHIIEKPETFAATAFGNKVVSGIHCTVNADSGVVAEWDISPGSE